MLSTTSESETRSSWRSAEKSGADPAADPVDLAHLRRYTMGDTALEKEVLQLFLLQLPVTIGALNDAASNREWMVAAHTLKGSCRAVGAWRIASLAEHAERHMADLNSAERREALEGIEEAAGQARAFIDRAYSDIP
ncbi:MAG: Hpt domain-containing protein [Hyphomicrobium sp.]|nr:Hpt domain-containing protein [Hyphomicrobium sp.]